jgi:hypothetical protein
VRSFRPKGGKVRASGIFWVVAIVLAGVSLFSGHGPPTSPAKQSELAVPSSASTDAPGKSSAAGPVKEAPTFEVTHTTTANVLRLRASPATDGEIVGSLAGGSEVDLVGSNGAWGAVVLRDGRSGWVSLQYLQPVGAEPMQLLTPAAPRKQAKQSSPTPKAGDPLRAPYVGTCDCPYDRKRNGARCGGSSAYSRPGGRPPQCYVGD